MLPTAVFDLLQADLTEAAALAEKGEVRAGYALLVAGLERAQADQKANRPWAAELLDQYSQALAHYSSRYGDPDAGA
jgi:hypothetical protein